MLTFHIEIRRVEDAPRQAEYSTSTWCNIMYVTIIEYNYVKDVNNNY